MSTWVIVGCGYTGTHLAQRLLDNGAAVMLTRRAPTVPAELSALVAAGASYHALDLDQPIEASWIPDHALVVLSTPPANQEAGRRERAFVAALSRAARLVYLSSTGVYGPGDAASLTDEDADARPAAEHGVARLAAETAVLGAAAQLPLSAVALRIAGIYGPGRGVIERMRLGNYRVIGDGGGYVSRVHVADLVSAIISAATIDPLPHTIVNVADDDPCPSLHYARAVARSLGVDDPPMVPVDQVSARVAALVGSNRRVANARLKRDFGVSLRYPSWRDSLDELVKR